MSATLARRLDRLIPRDPDAAMRLRIRRMSQEQLIARAIELAEQILADPATTPELAQLVRAALAEGDAQPPVSPRPPPTPALDALGAALREPA